VPKIRQPNYTFRGQEQIICRWEKHLISNRAEYKGYLTQAAHATQGSRDLICAAWKNCTPVQTVTLSPMARKKAPNGRDLYITNQHGRTTCRTSKRRL